MFPADEVICCPRRQRCGSETSYSGNDQGSSPRRMSSSTVLGNITVPEMIYGPDGYPHSAADGRLHRGEEPGSRHSLTRGGSTPLLTAQAPTYRVRTASDASQA